MKLEVEIDGRTRHVEVEKRGERFRLEIDGRAVEGDVLESGGAYTFFVGDRVVAASVSRVAGAEALRVEVGGRSRDVRVVDRKHRAAGGAGGAEGQQTIAAPMPGKVVEVLVAAGDQVELGQGLLVVEAMKMQNEVKAPKAGVVGDVRVSAGQAVTAGQPLVVID